MKYFKQLRYELDRDKLEAALHEVLQICPWQDKRTVSVNKFGKNDIYSPQICLTEKQTEEHSFRGGIGGHYDTMEKTGHEVSRLQDINEADYTKFIPDFAHTYFKEIYDMVSSDWKIGRVRLILSKPRRALSWHRDPEPRIHIPVKSQIGSKMIIEDEVHYMPAGTAWFTDTRNYHSQFNGSEEGRVHMVACVIKDTWEEKHLAPGNLL